MESRIEALIKGFQQGASGSFAPELSGIGKIIADRLFSDNTDAKQSFDTGKNNYKKAYEYYKNNYPKTVKTGEVLGYGGAAVSGHKILQKVYYDVLRKLYEQHQLSK